MTMFEEITTLSPVQFFTLTWDCPYVKGALKPSSQSKLPHLGDLLDEETFADLYMSWNEKGIELEIRVKDRTPEDSIELLFDTRDLKNKTVVSKFCHHFVFTPDERDGTFGKEISRFRNEDAHRLCEPQDLLVDVKGTESAYTLHITIPAHCLHGYEPRQFNRMGFTYRVNRDRLPAQHFAVCEDFAIEQNPSLWATIRLLGV